MPSYKWFREYGEYIQFGLMFPSAMIVGTLFGYGVDRWFGTHPWGKLIGLFLGMVAGAVNFIRDYKRLQSKSKSNESGKS